MRNIWKRRMFMEALSNNILSGKITFVPGTIEDKNRIVKSLNELGILAKAEASHKKNEETGINELTGYFFSKDGIRIRK